MTVRPIEVQAWSVRDSGLAAAPPRHRRLPGALRHHRGEGEAWPAEVTLVLSDDVLEAVGVGRWRASEVSVGEVRQGPPLTFVLRTPAGVHLLATAATAAGHRLVASLSDGPSGPR